MALFLEMFRALLTNKSRFELNDLLHTGHLGLSQQGTFKNFVELLKDRGSMASSLGDTLGHAPGDG